MKPIVQFLLFLLVLPFLIGIFLFVILPLTILLLILSLFIPSIRIFHISHASRWNNESQSSPEPATDETVYDVECTVVESGDQDHARRADQPPELKQ